MSSPAPDGETPTQRQARERRERRAAKIQAGGTARLQAIAGLSGRPHAAAAEVKPTSATASPSIQPRVDDDPDITDISEHHYTPRVTPRGPNPFDSGRSTPIPGMSLDQRQMPPGQGGEDPMMAMLQQMMGGGDPNAPGGLPPGLAEMFGATGGAAGGGGGMPGMPGMPQQQQPQPSSSAYIWRIVHALFSFALALYVTTNTTFTGSKASRTASEYSNEGFGQKLFYMFATAEVVLQSSRFFIERGQLPPSGILGTLATLLPPPYGGYVRIVGRYSVIYTTVVADAMVIVFVLGAMAWWNGVATS